MSKTIRRTRYTKALGHAICARIAQGASLRRVAADETMPDLATLVAWLVDNPPFRESYARAREIEADILADEVVDIADRDTQDNAAAAKVRVDARKWLAAKLKPGKYGEGRGDSPRGDTPVVYRVVTGIPRAPGDPDDEPADRDPVVVPEEP